ncbi:cyanase [Phanerochaete sordida]|uniref:Cyanate hydratase n=1 Tax=Phanerochaete sordida TaxID=48140 RepID=A0A9P3G0M3_9APHY|nr:cyanase [Phanerochaete sordida]
MAAPADASALRINPQTEPYSNLPSICVQLAEAKARLGLSFQDIGNAIGRDEVWVAAAFYAQAKLTKDDIHGLAKVLELDQTQLEAELGANWFPRRGLGPMPPNDPVLYRLYEGVLVYGHAIKAVVHEKFGDGIISMIDCTVKIDKKEDPKGDRVLLTFDGKFLKYATW